MLPDYFPYLHAHLHIGHKDRVVSIDRFADRNCVNRKYADQHQGHHHIRYCLPDKYGCFCTILHWLLVCRRTDLRYTRNNGGYQTPAMAKKTVCITHPFVDNPAIFELFLNQNNLYLSGLSQTRLILLHNPQETTADIQFHLF